MAGQKKVRPSSVNTVVVDTDVVSYLFKSHSVGDRYSQDLFGRTRMVSFMTVAELERWAIQRNWGATRLNQLRLYVERFTVVPSSPDLCLHWAQVTVTAQALGRRIECADAWIAATALMYSVPLVTNNRSDYLGVPDLKLVTHR